MITGCTGSLGGHLARRLMEDGWRVVGVARRTDPELEKLEPFRGVAIDLGTLEAKNSLFDLLKTENPALFVHAAVHYGNPRVLDRNLPEIETMFRVNAHSAFLAFAEYCEAGPMEQFCTFVPINSDAIFHTTATNAAYAASKAALRVLAAGLAERCKTSNGCVATLALGPLADHSKTSQLKALAEKRGISMEALTAEYMRRSNPFLVIEELIDLEACYRCIETIVDLGAMANGMVCRLDGGSAGALI
ncbi:NAD(P)-dependent oxidoreductase [Roseivivax marinus]|uniref:NAD(P)-dependent oxidoreductase n=1 Tax=Roseivivax marinus TaxID=1379903 RepID=UPI0023E4488D|nr:NAD(P)-dependent oxidoreductase [Roseivivax marinus]